MEAIIQYTDGVKFEADCRGHRVVCDQPLGNSGEDAGMSPPEFLLVSLGTCAGFYALQYLRTRALPLEGLKVRVTAEKAAQPARLGSFRIEVAVPELDRWQTAKGLLILAALVLGFLFTPVPREVLALGAAALLLTSRRMASRDLIGLVDWHLLVLFVGLFVVNHAVAQAGVATQANGALRSAGVDLGDPRWLFPATAVLSNLVSNVPAVMLLLPHASHPLAGPVLALSSTLAGNLLIVGSIANIIVVDQAAALGVRIGWREHARVGVPVTLATLAVAAAWLALRG
jgi:Na+/H+ antiporter NhaD/arsenite permease-like protein